MQNWFCIHFDALSQLSRTARKKTMSSQILWHLMSYYVRKIKLPIVSFLTAPAAPVLKMYRKYNLDNSSTCITLTSFFTRIIFTPFFYAKILLLIYKFPKLCVYMSINKPLSPFSSYISQHIFIKFSFPGSAWWSGAIDF